MFFWQLELFFVKLNRLMTGTFTRRRKSNILFYLMEKSKLKIPLERKETLAPGMYCWSKTPQVKDTRQEIFSLKEENQFLSHCLDFLLSNRRSLEHSKTIRPIQNLMGQ